MQAFDHLFEELKGDEACRCQVALAGALGLTPHWHNAAAALQLPLLPTSTVEEADRALGSSVPTVIVTPLRFLLDQISTESACRWLSTAVVVVVADREAEATLWRQLAWDALAAPESADAATLTLARAVAEANRRFQQNHLVTTYAQRLASLTTDERDVLEAVCDGRLNKQIAGDFKVSVRTVEQRRRRVFDKMGVDSAVPLAVLTAIVQTLSDQNGRRHRTPTAAPMTTRAPQIRLPMPTTRGWSSSSARATMN